MNTTINLIKDQEIEKKISKLENKLMSEGVTSEVLEEVRSKSDDVYHVEKLFDYVLDNVVDIIKGKNLTAGKILLISQLISSPQFSNDPKHTIDPNYIEVVNVHKITKSIEESIKNIGIIEYISSYHDLNALLNASYDLSWGSTTKILGSDAVVAAIQQEQCDLVRVLDIISNKNFSDAQVKILNTYEVANNVSLNVYEIQPLLKTILKHNLSSDQLQAFNTKFIGAIISHNNIDFETILESISKYHFNPKQIEVLNQASSCDSTTSVKTTEEFEHTLHILQKYSALEKPYFADVWEFFGYYPEPSKVLISESGINTYD